MFIYMYMYSKSRFLCVFWRIVKAREVDVAQCNCIVTLSIVIYVDNMYSQRNRPEIREAVHEKRKLT
jgi:hypothetical protein